MDLSDNYTLNINHNDIWHAIIDPYILQECIPSCRDIEQHSDNKYSAEILVKFGFIKIPFKVNLSILNIVENQSYDLDTQVISGPAKGTLAKSKITLTSLSQESTLLSYQAEVELNSKLSKINQSIIQLSAKKWLDKFFNRFEESIKNSLVTDSTD